MRPKHETFGGSKDRERYSPGMSYRFRKFLAAIVLLIWLPVYIVVAATVVGQIERPSVPVELGIYAVLGILWALPFRWVFRGIGREDPDAASKTSDQA